MTVKTTKPRVVPSVHIEDKFLAATKPIRLYTLEKQSPYLWNILEVTISHNRILTSARDVPSLKEIKMEKLLDLIESGGVLNESDR